MKIHFIGIGGIGVSALAKYHLKKGDQVFGSDLVASEITSELEKIGAKIILGKHKAENISKDIDVVIFSPAVLENNSELKKAKKLKSLGFKLQVLSYPQALGELTKKYFTIAICGSHGKSTITAMLGILLKRAGLNPTVIVGTKVKEFNNSNFLSGGKPILKYQKLNAGYLIIEACEHFASFLNYSPEIIILTNLEPDHLDYYKNFKNYVSSFKKFISLLPKSGILVANKDDETVKTLSIKNTIYYSLKQKEVKKLKKILKVPGDHNISNALACLALARIFKIPDKISFNALSKYKGAWRRFDQKTAKINNKNIKIISDYGHHPTQLKVTAKAVREKFPKKKIWCIYQPHQYQRTYYLLNDFIKVLREAPNDKIIVTDIYSVAGREKKEIKKKINSRKLVKAVNRKNVIYLPQNKILYYLKKNIKNGEVVIIMGAGDIYNLTLQLL